VSPKASNLVWLELGRHFFHFDILVPQLANHGVLNLYISFNFLEGETIVVCINFRTEFFLAVLWMVMFTFTNIRIVAKMSSKYLSLCAGLNIYVLPVGRDSKFSSKN
jgi:hypothetical protein